MNLMFKNFLNRVFGGLIGDDPYDNLSSKPYQKEEAPAKPLTEFERARKNFTVKDLVVISEEKYKSLEPNDKAWIDSLGNKVYFFKDATLTNIALIRSY